MKMTTETLEMNDVLINGILDLGGIEWSSIIPSDATMTLEQTTRDLNHCLKRMMKSGCFHHKCDIHADVTDRYVCISITYPQEIRQEVVDAMKRIGETE